MKKLIASHPAVRILLFLILGILVKKYNIFSIQSIGIFFLIIAIGLLFFSKMKDYLQINYFWIKGFLICLFIVNVGYIIGYLQDDREDPIWFGNQINKESYLKIIIIETPTYNKKYYKTIANVESIITANKSIDVFGKLILKIYDTNFASTIKIGSTMVLKNATKKIIPYNEQSRKYCNYLYDQQIYYEQYCNKSNSILISSTNSLSILSKMINKLQEKILNILRTNILNIQSLSIAQALLIGYRKDIDKALLQMYSNTGVIHIIAISGMHLGLIYGILLLVFNKLKQIKFIHKTIRPLIILGIIWIFTLLAGAAPSIARASILFTIILLADILDKKNYSYNTLAVAAIILLMIRPNNLWDIGFQLSYSAVLSIMIYYKPIKSIFNFQNKVFEFLWSSISICIAAQILTFPFILFYFKQFPVLFIFTNLLVVTISSLVLYLELFLIMIYKIDFLAKWTGVSIDFLISTMNNIVIYFSNLSYSSINNISSNLLIVLNIYLIIFCLTSWLLFKSPKSIKYFLVILIILNLVNANIF